ncbi:hypothetical protein KKA03_06215 [archaeon]|nr:hypothetical protein [archaeon]
MSGEDIGLHWGAVVPAVVSLLLILGSPVFAQGNHTGELRNLEIEVVYTNPYFYTDDGYAGYYIGLPMTYELRIKNTGKRTFMHLDITAIQEYHESGTCYRYGEGIAYSKGDPMPGETTEKWSDVTLRKGEEIVLRGGYVPPYATCDGLDQTHVIIKHSNNGNEEAAVMYFNPEAGIYCPPPPDEVALDLDFGTIYPTYAERKLFMPYNKYYL